MDHKLFQEWLSVIDRLSTAQRRENRCCVHCGAQGPITGCKAHGLQWYHCNGWSKNFNAVTGKPISGLHRKRGSLALCNCLSEGMTVRSPVRHCRLSDNTSFCWRNRFPAAKGQGSRKLTGTVEADEIYVLESRRGDRQLDHKACRRGDKAGKRSLSGEQLPVLVAADRSGMTVSSSLSSINADALREHIEPFVEGEFVLVSDGRRAWPPCATEIGARNEALNLSGGERVRDTFHIQTVNNRHSQLKSFLRRFRGVVTKYTDNYLRLLQRIALENASSRTCLAAASDRSFIRFAN